MPPQKPHPTLKLSRLRGIGRSSEDPIGLLRAGKNWNYGDCLPFADEYHAYLTEARGRLSQGKVASEVASYLDNIEVEHKG